MPRVDSRELAGATWPRKAGLGGARGPQEHPLPGLDPGDTSSQCGPSQGLPPASAACFLPPPSRCLFFFQNIRLPPRQTSKGGVPETPTLHTLMSLHLGVGVGGGVSPSHAQRGECKVEGASLCPQLSWLFCPFLSPAAPIPLCPMEEP